MYFERKCAKVVRDKVAPLMKGMFLSVFVNVAFPDNFCLKQNKKVQPGTNECQKWDTFRLYSYILAPNMLKYLFFVAPSLHAALVDISISS